MSRPTMGTESNSVNRKLDGCDPISLSSLLLGPAGGGCSQRIPPTSSVDVQLFECHRTLIAVRESVDAKYRELEAKYQSALEEMAEARRELEEKQLQIEAVTEERNEVKDQLARERCGDGGLVREMSKENGKMIRRMREMKAEAQSLRDENKRLRERLAGRGIGGEGGGDGDDEEELVKTKKKEAAATRSRFERRLSGEKRPNWFMGLGDGGKGSSPKQMRPSATGSVRSSPWGGAATDSIRSTKSSCYSMRSEKRGKGSGSNFWAIASASLQDEASICSSRASAPKPAS